MDNPNYPSYNSSYGSTEAPSFAQTELIGQIVGDRYQVLNYLGEGGMSCVYRAGHLVSRQIVALKIMHPHLLVDGSANRRFQLEAQAASALIHPHIVRVVDGGMTAQGRPFLAMDYLEGVQLSELIHNRRHPPELETLLHIFTQICHGMELAHSKSILHRDLRPSQIMLVEEEDDPYFVKIMDFGIARIIMPSPEEAASAEVLGNPYYMSPEACRQRPVDQRSDIYSMGCLMYESLTGRVPIHGSSPEDTLYKQMNEMPPALVVPGEDARLVKQLEHIVLKCMEKEPGRRYQTMSELRMDLEQAPEKAAKGSETMALAALRAGEVQRTFSTNLGGLGKVFLIASIAALAATTIVALVGVFLLGTDVPSLMDRFITYDGDAIADSGDQPGAKPGDKAAKKEEFPGESAANPSTATSAPDKEWTACTENGFEAFKERDYTRAKSEFMKAMNVVYTANKNLSLDRANVEGALASLALLGYLDKGEKRSDTAFGYAVDTIMTCALNPLTSKDQVCEAWGTMGRANELINNNDNAQEAYVQYAMHCPKAYAGEKTFDTEQSALNAAHAANFFAQRKPREGMVASAYQASRSKVLNIARQTAVGLQNSINQDKAQIANGQVPKDQIDLAKLEMSNQEQEMTMLAAWLNKESRAPALGPKAWQKALEFLQKHNDKVCDEMYDYAEKTSQSPFNQAAILNNRVTIELFLMETPSAANDPKVAAANAQKYPKLMEWLNTALEKAASSQKGEEFLKARILYNKAALEWKMNDTIAAMKDRMEAKQAWERSPKEVSNTPGKS